MCIKKFCDYNGGKQRVEAKAEIKYYIKWIFDSPLLKTLWNILISLWLSLRNVDGSCAEDFILVLCDMEKTVDGHLSEFSFIDWWYRILFWEAAIALSLPELDWLILGLHRMPVKFL